MHTAICWRIWTPFIYFVFLLPWSAKLFVNLRERLKIKAGKSFFLKTWSADTAKHLLYLAFLRKQMRDITLCVFSRVCFLLFRNVEQSLSFQLAPHRWAILFSIRRHFSAFTVTYCSNVLGLFTWSDGFNTLLCLNNTKIYMLFQLNFYILLL